MKMRTSKIQVEVEDDFIDENTLKNYSGNGTVFSSFFNFGNTIVGAGILALPFSFKGCGITLGMLFIIVYALAASYAAHLLVLCRLPPIRGGRTYEDFAAKMFGKRIGPTITRLCIVVRFMGALVAYIAVIGEIISPYINKIVNMDERLITFIVSTFTMYPLINLRKIDSLSFTSSIAVFLILFCMGTVIVKGISITLSPTWDPSEIVYYKFGYEMIGALPIISFAFTYHPNVHPIFEELKVPTKKNILKASYSAVAIICCLYLVVASCGYLAFLDEVSDNILVDFKNSFIMDIVNVAYSFVICFSYPVICFPIRKIIDEMIFSSQESRLRCTIEALIIYIISFVLGISVPGIGVVFGITGGTAGAMIVYILPAAFYLHLKKSNKEVKENCPWFIYRYFSLEKLPAILLLLLGIFTSTFGTYSVIVDIIKGNLDSNI